jgi:threonine dehydratase
MKMLTLDKFEEASEKVKEVTLETKLVYSDYLSDQTGNKVYLKPENMQFTGAYKVRGAYYKISTLSEEERQRGLITASAGNHAQGVAYAAKCYGCNCNANHHASDQGESYQELRCGSCVVRRCI